MKAVSLALLIVGLTACEKSTPEKIDPQMIGEFLSQGIDSGILLQIKEDHSYVLREVGYGSEHSHPIEGRWSFEGGSLLLAPYGRQWVFKIVKKDDQLFLAGEGGRFEKQPIKKRKAALTKKPNQALEPTCTSVTPRACARVAPAAQVAHL